MLNVNVSQKSCKLQTTYDRDNTKQAEMPYFHCGPSRQKISWSDQIKMKKVNNDNNDNNNNKKNTQQWY